LSGNGNHLTLVNSPTFTTNVFQFNGTNQYAFNNLNLSAGTSTIIGAARYSGATRGRMITSSNNNWLMGHHSTSTQSFYAEGWVTAPGTGSSDTNWRILTATNDVTSDLYSLYVNSDRQNVATPAGGSAGPNGICVGCYKPALTEFSTGECSFVLAYNRVLTQQEVKQNFNALRGRFGI
jgi:hypothetical protein